MTAMTAGAAPGASNIHEGFVSQSILKSPSEKRYRGPKVEKTNNYFGEEDSEVGRINIFEKHKRDSTITAVSDYNSLQ